MTARAKAPERTILRIWYEAERWCDECKDMHRLARDTKAEAKKIDGYSRIYRLTRYAVYVAPPKRAKKPVLSKPLLDIPFFTPGTGSNHRPKRAASKVVKR